MKNFLLPLISLLFLPLLSYSQLDGELKEINFSDYISQEFSLKGVLNNNGSTDLTSIDFNWQINSGVINTQTITGFTISSDESIEIEHSTEIQFEDSLTTEEISVWISNPNGSVDENTANDTIIRAVEVLDEWVNRRVLIEHFTNASCGPCADQNPALTALMLDGVNPDKIAHIAYHTSWPGTDPMYSFNEDNGEGNTRVSFYDVSGVPNAVVGGNDFQGSPASITQEMIDAGYTKPALLKIATEQQIIGDTIYISAEIISLINLPSTQLKAHVVLTELKEYESAPGGNGEKVFEDVMRTMITDEEGYSLDPMNAYDTVKVSFKKKIDTYEIDEPEVTVFIQDNEDKDILNTYKNFENIGPLGVKTNVEGGIEDYIIDEIIEILFNDPVRNIDNSEITNPSTLITFKEDNSSGADVAFTATINSEKTKIIITPDQWLQEDKNYFISLQSIENEDEFNLSEKQYPFKTGIMPNPTAVFSIANEATDVNISWNHFVILSDSVRLLDDSELLDPTPLIIFTETDKDGEPVSFTAEIDDNKDQITIIQTNPLKSNQKYYLEIKAEVENRYDKVLVDTAITFTTKASATGIDKITSQDLHIYPNPSNDYVNIDLNINEKSAVIVRIYNEVGQLVQTEDKGSLSSGNQNINLDLRRLRKGLYFINITVENEAVTRKIQIQK